MRQIRLPRHIGQGLPQLDQFSSQMDLAGSMYFLTNGTIRIADSTLCIFPTEWDDELLQRLDSFDIPGEDRSWVHPQRSDLRNLQEKIEGKVAHYLGASGMRGRANVVFIGRSEPSPACADGGNGTIIRSKGEWMRGGDAVRTVVTMRQGSHFNIIVQQKSFGPPGNLGRSFRMFGSDGSARAVGDRIYDESEILSDIAIYYLFRSNGFDVQQRYN